VLNVVVVDLLVPLLVPNTVVVDLLVPWLVFHEVVQFVLNVVVVE
jgi:hypothetical protein